MTVTVAGGDMDKRAEVRHSLRQVHEFFGPTHVHCDRLAELIVELDGGGRVKDYIHFLSQLHLVTI